MKLLFFVTDQKQDRAFLHRKFLQASLIFVTKASRAKNHKMPYSIGRLSGVCIIKLITAVIYRFCNKLECLSLAKPLQLRLMFVGKARGLPQSGTPERCFTWVGSGLTRKNKDYVREACEGQTLQLITKYVNYGCNKFYSTGSVLKRFLRKFFNQ